jgi:DNA repair protein RadD
MRFDDLLSRADDETLQSLLGGTMLRLLKLLDPSSVTPTQMRRVLMSLRSSTDLLSDPVSRTLLLELLRPSEARSLVIILGGNSNTDPYSFLRKLRLRRHSDRERALFDFFELPTPQPEKQEDSPESSSVSSRFPLFSHQREAARKVRRALSQEPRRVLLHMPTGAGKTRTTMHIISDHLRAHESTLVVWLAYSEELCEQAASEFESAWHHLGDREVRVYRFWGNRDLDFENIRDGLIVASLTKFYRAGMKRLAVLGVVSGRCSLVVMDEAHQATAETYRLVLETLASQGQPAALLGLSATPGRTWDDMDVDAELAALFGRCKVTLDISGYASPIDYLVAEGYLARATYRPLLHSGGKTLSPADLQRIERELDIPQDILQRLAEDEQRNLAIVAEIERMASRHTHIIVFAASVSHARLLAAVLNARGKTASAISGETPSAERARILERYKNDNATSQILCNFGVLTTGFDAPRTSANGWSRYSRSTCRGQSVRRNCDRR